MLFAPKEKGQGMVEYALIIVLVAVVLIVVLALVGSNISTVFSKIISGLNKQYFVLSIERALFSQGSFVKKLSVYFMA